ncbi:MAG: hypothetical protein V4598_05620 [Bdellovibrionota bacterium]
MSKFSKTAMETFLSIIQSDGKGSFTFPKSAMGLVESAFDEFNKNYKLKIDFQKVPPDTLAQYAAGGAIIGAASGALLGKSWQSALFGALIGVGAGAILAQSRIILVSERDGNITLFTGGSNVQFH